MPPCPEPSLQAQLEMTEVGPELDTWLREMARYCGAIDDMRDPK